MKNKEIDYWDKEDSEYLEHTDKDEAIEYIIDGEPEPLPLEIDIIGYSRERVDLDRFAKNIAETLAEYIDEEYGDPDACHLFDKSDENLIDAAKEFVAKATENYKPWACKEVPESKEVINVKKWVTENRKDWILDGVEFEEDLK